MTEPYDYQKKTFGHLTQHTYGDPEHAELAKNLEGLFAYDDGGIDSGIHDDVLKQRCKEQWGRLDRISKARIVRHTYLSDEALLAGYGLEDMADFLRWLEDKMGELE